MRCGDAERVAAIGAAETARGRCVHDLRATGDGSQRKAAGKALCHGH